MSYFITPAEAQAGKVLNAPPVTLDQMIDCIQYGLFAGQRAFKAYTAHAGDLAAGYGASGWTVKVTQSGDPAVDVLDFSDK